jgi:serine/threonine-protein kinase RsbW
VATWVKTSFRMRFRVIAGLQPFAGPTRCERSTAGETVRKRTAMAAAVLGPPQAQITRLAWDGRANPEISTQPFIGLRTAGWHLRMMQSSKPAGVRSLGHAYPGKPEQVQRVRADLRGILSGCPIADETILVASELAANAVTHSNSRQPGGRFIVRAEVCPADYVWVEVEDQGGTWAGQQPGDGRHHGLDIVQAIAGDGNWGIDGDATLGHVAWARLDWPGR